MLTNSQKTITFTITPTVYKELQILAKEAGVTPEALCKFVVEYITLNYGDISLGI